MHKMTIYAIFSLHFGEKYLPILYRFVPQMILILCSIITEPRLDRIITHLRNTLFGFTPGYEMKTSSHLMVF